MKDGEDYEAVIPHLVGNDVRGISDDQLARAGFSPWTAEVGILGQIANGLADGSGNISRGLGLIAFNVGLNVRQVPYGLASPNYSHEGAGTLRFLPQDLSQRSTFS
jgi:hypothetical protein